MRTRLVAGGAGVVLTVLLTGCAGGGGLAALTGPTAVPSLEDGTTSDVPDPGPTSDSPTDPDSTPASPVASPTAIPTTNPELAGAILPIPDGYEVDPDPDTPIGAITPSQFDTMTSSGAAAGLGFVAGRSSSFQGVDTADSVEVDLLLFGTDAGASRFARSVEASLLDDPDQAPVRGTTAAIPGAVTIDATKEDSDSTAEYDVVAHPGRVVMIVEFATDLGAQHRRDALKVATAQYARL